ncbi:hypothetical protein HK104_011431 [Borealophlyctis nickersoniae]|nr:hypothetical protein HK104_011431 [Borealophlyctis nickersoniae]
MEIVKLEDQSGNDSSVKWEGEGGGVGGGPGGGGTSMQIGSLEELEASFFNGMAASVRHGSQTKQPQQQMHQTQQPHQQQQQPSPPQQQQHHHRQQQHQQQQQPFMLIDNQQRSLQNEGASSCQVGSPGNVSLLTASPTMELKPSPLAPSPPVISPWGQLPSEPKVMRTSKHRRVSSIEHAMGGEEIHGHRRAASFSSMHGTQPYPTHTASGSDGLQQGGGGKHFRPVHRRGSSIGHALGVTLDRDGPTGTGRFGTRRSSPRTGVETPSATTSAPFVISPPMTSQPYTPLHSPQMQYQQHMPMSSRAGSPMPLPSSLPPSPQRRSTASSPRSGHAMGHRRFYSMGSFASGESDFPVPHSNPAPRNYALPMNMPAVDMPQRRTTDVMAAVGHRRAASSVSPHLNHMVMTAAPMVRGQSQPECNSFSNAQMALTQPLPNPQNHHMTDVGAVPMIQGGEFVSDASMDMFSALSPPNPAYRDGYQFMSPHSPAPLSIRHVHSHGRTDSMSSIASVQSSISSIASLSPQVGQPDPTLVHMGDALMNIHLHPGPNTHPSSDALNLEQLCMSEGHSNMDLVAEMNAQRIERRELNILNDLQRDGLSDMGLNSGGGNGGGGPLHHSGGGVGLDAMLSQSLGRPTDKVALAAEAAAGSSPVERHQLRGQRGDGDEEDAESVSGSQSGDEEEEEAPAEETTHGCKWTGCDKVFDTCAELVHHVSEGHIGNNWLTIVAFTEWKGNIYVRMGWLLAVTKTFFKAAQNPQSSSDTYRRAAIWVSGGGMRKTVFASGWAKYACENAFQH